VIKRMIMLVATALLALTMVVPAFAAPKECTPGDPGCKTETTTKKEAGASPGFTETETQRGNVDAKGTESTETSACFGPSGKELSPTHPQCQ
jgi:hypothetical protein